MRTYIFMDSLRRVLKRGGYDLLHVMNITDVGHLTDDGDDNEDKLEVASREQKKTPGRSPNITPASSCATSTRCTSAALKLSPSDRQHRRDDRVCKGALRRRFGYEISDGIYYDISKFPEYGMLSRLKLDDQLSGAGLK